MKKFSILLFSLITLVGFSQTTWKSTNYGYSIEIPRGYSKFQSIGSNVDFKANNGLNSIVVVVNSLPLEYSQATIWDMMGDLSTYGAEWEYGAKEHMNNPKFLKYGKTTIDGLQSLWYDYTTVNPHLYSKTYQVKKGTKLYTITLTCEYENYNNNSSIWYRFKDKIAL